MIHGFKPLRYIIDLLLISLSSILLILSFPEHNLGFLAWVSLFPLFLTLHNRSLLYSFFLSTLSGILFFEGTFYWIHEIQQFTQLHNLILALYLSSYFGIFGLSFNYILNRWGTIAVLFAAPFIWISLEYIRANLSFLSFPLALLAQSQYRYLSIIQIASIAGMYSISFLIVMVNSALTAIFFTGLQQTKDPSSSFSNSSMRKGRFVLIITTLILITLVISYGHIALSTPFVGKSIMVSAVQGNIEQTKKWNQQYATFIMRTYADLTHEAALEKPALIIWPETATPKAINLDPMLFREVIEIARDSKTCLLLGSSQHQKFENRRKRDFLYSNSAFLIDTEPRLHKFQRYDKIRLLPFGEYLPFQKFIPWSYLQVPKINEYAAGKEFTIFEVSDLKFGVIICWENLFPDLVRQFVRKGAQFMVNITNEAWFGKTAAPYQFVSMSVFRAVENRVFLVRCANTGVSCIIDPYGRIVNRVWDAKGQDIFVRGIVSSRIIPHDSRTFYTIYGDILIVVAFFGFVAFLLFAWRKGKHKSI